MNEFSIRTQPFRLGAAHDRALWLAQAVRAPMVWFWALWTVDWAVVIFIQLKLAIVDHDRNAVVLGFSFVPPVFMCLSAAILYIAQRRDSRDPVHSGDQLMILDNSAVRVVGYGFDTRQTWAAFNRVYRSGNRLFLHAPGRRPYIVPKRALEQGLASPDDWSALATAARAAMQAARRASPPLPPLQDPPDNRDLWRSRPFQMSLYYPPGVMILRMLAGAMLIPSAAFLFAIAQFGFEIVAEPDWWSFLLCLTAACLVYGLAMLLLVRQALKRRVDLKGDREICFTRDYVRSTTRAFDSRVDWVNVRRVYRSSGVFYFRMKTGLFHVPASAFATKAEAMAFFTQAVAFWRAAEARRQSF